MNVNRNGNNNQIKQTSFGAKFFIVAEGDPKMGTAGRMIESAVGEARLASNETEKNCRMLGIPVAFEMERFTVDGNTIKSTRGLNVDFKANDPKTVPETIATHVFWTGRDAARVHKKYPNGFAPEYLYKNTPITVKKLDAKTLIMAIQAGLFGFRKGYILNKKPIRWSFPKID